MLDVLRGARRRGTAQAGPSAGQGHQRRSAAGPQHAKAANGLTRAFRDQSTRKLYWALTAGVPRPDEGRIDLPLAKLKRGGGEKMRHDPEDGKPASTSYRTLMTWGRTVGWVALSPLTGRTHQLRAHLQEIGAPVLGDAKYAARAAFPEGIAVEQLMLHAREIALPHPGDGTTLRIQAPLPAHMAAAFQQLGFDPDAGRRRVSRRVTTAGSFSGDDDRHRRVPLPSTRRLHGSFSQPVRRASTRPTLSGCSA